jgi:hypothetical protein
VILVLEYIDGPTLLARKLAGQLTVAELEPAWSIQLRGGDPDQHLPAGMTAAALLDRPDRRVQPIDHIQPVGQLGHRQHPRHRRQRRIRRTDPHPPPTTTP